MQSPSRIQLVALVLLACFISPGASAERADTSEQGMLGVLTPRFEVELEPSFEGQLLEVHVRIGDAVAEGALVAVLDPEPVHRDIEEAEAKLEQVRAEQQEAATRLLVAEEALQRQRTLVEKDAVSKEVVRAAERSVELANAELHQAQAVVKQREAANRQLQSILRQTQIRAPFSGTVAERYSNTGATVGPGRPVARLISNEMLWARFAVPVSRASDLSIDRPVKIVVTLLREELSGIIRQIGSEVDPASGMIICEAAVAWPDGWTGPPLAGQAVRIWLTPSP